MLYVLRINDSMCKIGITTDFKNRLKWYAYNLGRTPDIIFSKEYDYRCSRCFEFLIAWQCEYFCSSQLDMVLECIGSAESIAVKHKCKQSKKSHAGISVRDFCYKCGIKSESVASPWGPSVSGSK